MTWGSRGEVEITRHAGDEISNSVRVAFLIAKFANLGTVIVWALTTIVWIQFCGFREYWDALTGWVYIGWAFALGGPWIAAPVAAILWYFVPKLKNPNWPAPFAQVDVSDPEAPITWDDARHMPWKDDRPAAEPREVVREIVWKVEGSLDTGQGQSIHDHPTLKDARAWKKFCSAVVNEGRNFSQTEAIRRHKVNPSDWETMFNRFRDRGWVDAVGERGTPELSPTGKAWVRHYARSPLPHPGTDMAVMTAPGTDRQQTDRT